MKNSHKLLSALILLVVSIFAATSTTYAWITMNNNAMIEEIYMEVGSATDGLFVGVESYVDESNRACNINDDKIASVASKTEFNEFSLTKQSFYDVSNYILNRDALSDTITSTAYDELPALIQSIYEPSNYTLNSTISSEAYGNLSEIVKTIYELNEEDYSINAEISGEEYDLLDESNIKPLYTTENDGDTYTFNLNDTVNNSDYLTLSSVAAGLYSISNYSLDEDNDMLSETINVSSYNNLTLQEKSYYVVNEYQRNLHNFSNVTLYRAFINDHPEAEQFYQTDDISKLTTVIYSNVLSIDKLKKSIQFVDASTPITADENGKLNLTLSHVTNNAGSLQTISNEDAAKFIYTNKTSAVANKHYLCFELFFRSTSVSDRQGIFLVGGGTKTSSVKPYGNVTSKYDLKAWDDFSESMFGKKVNLGEKLNVRAANAVRVGFSNVVKKGDSKTNFMPKTINYSWDPNPTVGFTNNNTYASNESQTKANLAEEWARHITNDKTISVGTASPCDLKTVANANVVPTNETEIVRLDVSGDFSEGATWVSIWLEGTDSECFNALLEDEFSTVLSFATINVPNS